MSIIATPLDEAGRKTTGQALQETLTELLQLSLESKQLHWNVIGPRFRSVHLQLDEVVALARGHADAVAERAAAIGVNPDGRPATVARSGTLVDVEPGWIPDQKAVGHTATMLCSLAERLHGRIEALEKADPVSQDLLIQIAADVEKQAWMFQAQLNDPSNL